MPLPRPDPNPNESEQSPVGPVCFYHFSIVLRTRNSAMIIILGAHCRKPRNQGLNFSHLFSLSGTVSIPVCFDFCAGLAWRHWLALPRP